MLGQGQRILGAVKHRNSERLIDIFGYSSKGLPGLDIVGLGQAGRLIKEKFVYLSRTSGLKIPVKRYVLCVEDSAFLREVGQDEVRWLELPLLILFWGLAEQFQFAKLEDCIACGHVHPSGRILSRVPDLKEVGDESFYKIISKSSPGPSHNWLPLDQMFSDLGDMSLESYPQSLN